MTPVNPTNRSDCSSPLILASASPRRALLLREAGYDCRIQVAGVDELPPGAKPPEALCVANARLKAEAIAKRYPEALVIGCDTIVCLDGTVFGKPTSVDDAVRMLQALQGRRHEVLTGYVLLGAGRQIDVSGVERTGVHFRALSTDAIRAYLESIEPLDKAGAYAIQDNGDRIIEQLEGSRANVMGLPVERLTIALQALGI
ncbi:MAG: Maf family protein, partial [Verrucomicrobia bacterium]|nr:Maf family protein [Verrucomicrobiota bacterium]